MKPLLCLLLLTGCASVPRTPEQEAAHQARLNRFALVIGQFVIGQFVSGIGNGFGSSAAQSLRSLEGFRK